jgi:hypothetical protein
VKSITLGLTHTYFSILSKKYGVCGYPILPTKRANIREGCDKMRGREELNLTG